MGIEIPRFKPFEFILGSSYTIPDYLSGKPGAIALDIYGDENFYRPLCSANAIDLPYSLRVGIRPRVDAFMIELDRRDLTESEKEDEVDRFKTYHRITSLDWFHLQDRSSGMVTDLYTGKILVVPTQENCVTWLEKYGKISI